MSRERQPQPSLPALAVATSVFVLAMAPFAQAIRGGFTNWDDVANITSNLEFRGFAARHWSWFWSTYHLGVYEPISWMLKALIYVLASGVRPLPFHVVSLLLHGANAVLLYFIARRLLVAARPNAGVSVRLGAAVAALLFACHPLRTEVVAWASGQSYALAAFFSLLAVLLYLRSQLALAVLAYACAVLSKTAAVPLCVVLLLLDVYPLRRVGRTPRTLARVLAEKVPFCAVVAVVVAITMHIPSRGQIPPERFSLVSRLVLAGQSLTLYVEKTLVPDGLTPFYALPFSFAGPSTRTWVEAIAALAITAAVLVFRKRMPAVAVAWLAHAAYIAPVSGLVRHGDHYGADRYSYLSCLGFAVLAGGGVAHLWSRRSIAVRFATAAGTLIVLAALAALSARQTAVWRDSQALWRHAVAVDPSNWLAHNNLASDHFTRGEYGAAEQAAQAALRSAPEYVVAIGTLADTYEQQGRAHEAAAGYRKALGLDPLHDSLYKLAPLLRRLGESPAAIQLLRERLSRTPDDARSLMILGVLLNESGDAEEGERSLKRATELAASDPQPQYQLALVYGQRGKLALAEQSMRRALAIDPRYPKASYQLGYILRVQGRTQEAIEAYRVAVANEPAHVESRHELAQSLLTLAVAYGDAGRFDEAARTAREAFELARTGPRELVSAIQEAQAALEAGKPYRPRARAAS